MMFGKVVHSEIRGRFCAVGRAPEARDLVHKSVRALNFRVGKGEIFGFYGLRGAGKSETRARSWA